MDKKMAKVSKKIRTAEKDIRKKKPKQAEKVLKKAVKENVKLTKIDREVRDPAMKKLKKLEHSGCHKPLKKGK